MNSYQIHLFEEALAKIKRDSEVTKFWLENGCKISRKEIAKRYSKGARLAPYKE